MCPPRVERIIHFDTMANDTGSLPEVIADLLDDDRFKRAIQTAFLDLRWPEQKDADEAAESYWRFRREWMEEELSEKATGWMVWVSTPKDVQQVQGERVHKIWSWHTYVTEVFCAAEYNDAIVKAVAWANKLHG